VRRASAPQTVESAAFAANVIAKALAQNWLAARANAFRKLPVARTIAAAGAGQNLRGAPSPVYLFGEPHKRGVIAENSAFDAQFDIPIPHFRLPARLALQTLKTRKLSPHSKEGPTRFRHSR
jgi:hypothetical protein